MRSLRLEDTRRCEELPCSWIIMLNIVKIVFLPRAICIFSGIPSKFQHRMIKERKNLKFYGKTKDQG